MQDWNVDPHMAFPAYKQLQTAGFEIKGLFGQWGHHYPDRPGDQNGMSSGRGAEAFPSSVRYDWAQDLLEWFNYYLYEGNMKPALHVEMQDNMGGWRVEETWPVDDREYLQLPIGEGLNVVCGGMHRSPECTPRQVTRPQYKSQADNDRRSLRPSDPAHTRRSTGY